MLSFEDSFFNNLNNNFIFENRPKIAIAVSGGPDSIAMVFILNKWIKKKKGKLIALIIDHKIRKESFTESKLVKQYLQLNNIENKIFRISKKKILKKQMNVARINRYSILTNYCLKNNIFHLFFGHHKDDNIETFLLRKVAGSNFEGLNSIKEKAVYNRIRILRPFIKFSKNQILNYNKKLNLLYVFDPSNLNDKYSRVLIRNFLLKYPKYNKLIKSEFNLISKNFKDYKQMVFQIFHDITILIQKKKIIFDYNKYIMLDKELQIKMIEIIFKFFYPKNHFLRYNKISNAINRILSLPNVKDNISGMKIINSNNLLIFTL
tara:strand:+ start:395 stop:1354 length:960 start_codon:yes stop_codon:yes gene_type:complete